MASLADALAYSKNLANKFTSLNTPQDMSLGETAADIGLGFVPGIGTAQAARDFERSRRDNDWLGMGLSAAGMIPVVGGVASGAKKVSKASKLAEALQKAPRLSRAENEALGLYHDIGGGIKLNRPISEMQFEHTLNPNMPLTERKILTPEEMVGGYAIPFVGDRARTGTIFTSVEGKPLSNQVIMEGGPDYMRAHINPETGKSGIWASDTGVISKLNRTAQEAAREGKPVYGVYSAMSPTGVNFNTMLTEAVMNQFDPSKLNKRQIEQFNDAVRNVTARNTKGELVHPGGHFLGIENPKAAEQLLRYGEGDLRKTFIERMNTAEFQKMGFPDVPATRAAITEPELMNATLGQSGRTIAKISPELAINPTPAVPHKTYNTQLLGDYAGGLETEVPSQVMFPNFYNQRRALGKSPSSDWRSYSMSNVVQPLNQEWLDQLMQYVEKTKAGK
jgi:hypothetical protein